MTVCCLVRTVVNMQVITGSSLSLQPLHSNFPSWELIALFPPTAHCPRRLNLLLPLTPYHHNHKDQILMRKLIPPNRSYRLFFRKDLRFPPPALTWNFHQLFISLKHSTGSIFELQMHILGQTIWDSPAELVAGTNWQFDQQMLCLTPPSHPTTVFFYLNSYLSLFYYIHILFIYFSLFWYKNLSCKGRWKVLELPPSTQWERCGGGF